MKTQSIGFIGGGRITRIMLQAFKNKNVYRDIIRVFDTDRETLLKLQKQFPEIEIAHSAEEAAETDTVFIALHPPMIVDTLAKIKDHVKTEAVVISLAPKISIEKMAGMLPAGNIARLIPNATSVINRGYNPVSFAENFEKDKKDQLLELLATLGNTFEVAEEKLESYAIVSAMLPTYFWFQWKKMIEIGVETGMTERESTETVHQTLLASLALMFESGMDYAQVTDLIPVKPIGDREEEIIRMFDDKLLGLFGKIRP